MYHGIILDPKFENIRYPETYKCFAKRKNKTNPWKLYGVYVAKKALEQSLVTLQQNMKTDKPYLNIFKN